MNFNDCWEGIVMETHHLFGGRRPPSLVTPQTVEEY